MFLDLTSSANPQNSVNRGFKYTEGFVNYIV